ncbi:MAG: hypothetical protein OXC91_01145 [Rhodobacteraceae bacterium]|nr:hypothetical protein [Paracoccaceae bacterium]
MWTGYFNRHSACLDLEIHASNRQDQSIKIPAIIDTGFTGFVQIDIQMTHALGWLSGGLSIGTTQIADGKTIPIGLFQSPVIIQDDSVTGLCQFPLRPNAPCLVGMDLLRRAERVLVMSKDKVFLLEEKRLNLSGP